MDRDSNAGMVALTGTHLPMSMTTRLCTLHPSLITFADAHDIYEYDEAFLDDDFDAGSITASPDNLMVYGFAHQTTERNTDILGA